MENKITRRQFVREVTISATGIIISQWIPVSDLLAANESKMVITHGPSPDKITAAAIDALGGMGRFVSKGDVVALKPNIGWDRTPAQAANTHPAVIQTLARLCLESGAKEVRVIDNTCNEPRRCYKRSGIQDAAKKAGAVVSYYDERKDRKMKIGGQKIKEWPVNRSIYEVDCLINVPVAKHHSLSRCTLGMKNWFGAIGGRRNKLHQDIDQTIADLAAFFKPKLIVLDAFRILTRNGPQGGNPKDVEHPQTIIAATDQVAIDAFGGTLFGLKHDELSYVRKTAEMGLGTFNIPSLNPKEITVG
ncbi:DUF362 domain-containing protein [candidate division CSSED10-310 bacterium]|uniref:DUF362 domain-containing protein n=1 Tax=candidate division CSSED10-310 bacterium TaxID=2855610 RepID=A0ABV6Z0I7_UNCC1